MILIELNEFSPTLLFKAARQFDLKNLLTISQFDQTETEADEKEERFGLDPWVQWPSIHTGKPASSHGLHHLADAKNLAHPQLWDSLADAGITSGVWGAMNAKFNEAPNIRFYFPDPWTYTESASSNSLNRLLALPRYYAQHYLDLNGLKLAENFIKTASFFIHPVLLGKVLAFLPFIARKYLNEETNNVFLFSLFDLINAIAFKHYCLQQQVDFKLIFLNSVAHSQHHVWTEIDGFSADMQTTFEFLDHSIWQILSIAEEDEAIVISNAFSQYCSLEKNEYLYRQKNPEAFFRLLGLQADCEQLMTNDSQLIFPSEALAKDAQKLLQSFTIMDQELLQVSVDTQDRKRLFCQMLVWDDIPLHEQFCNDKQQFDFYEHFEKVVKRSGSHDAKGIVLSKGIDLPKTMRNYDLHDHLLNSYGVKQ